MRIASLVPSATDLACALGLGPNLVGISHECDHPEAAGLPVLTRSNVPSAPATAPEAVDRAVSQAVQEGLSLYAVDRELLRALSPDVVVGQSICDVCAVAEPELSPAVPKGARLIMLSATSVSGLADDVFRLGDATERFRRAKEVVASVQEALASLPKVASLKVLTLEWGEPPFLGGHWVPELVEFLGAEHLLSRPGEASRRCSYEEIRAARPDCIVFMPCGYHLKEARAEAERLEALRTLDAEVWVTNATRLFSRCTPQAVADGAKTLASIFTGTGLSPEWGMALDRM